MAMSTACRLTSAVPVPTARVPVVMIVVSVPPARCPLMAAAFTHVMAARPDVMVAAPAVVATAPNVAATHNHVLFARGRRLLAPGVNDQNRRLSSRCCQRRHSQARQRQGGQSHSPIRHAGREYGRARIRLISRRTTS